MDNREAQAKAILDQVGSSPSAESIASCWRAGEWDLAALEALDDVVDGYGNVDTQVIKQFLNGLPTDLKQAGVANHVEEWLTTQPA